MFTRLLFVCLIGLKSILAMDMGTPQVSHIVEDSNPHDTTDPHILYTSDDVHDTPTKGVTAGSSHSLVTDIDTILTGAAGLFRAGKADEAAAIYQQLITSDETDDGTKAFAANALGVIYRDKNERLQAKKYFELGKKLGSEAAGDNLVRMNEEHQM